MMWLRWDTAKLTANKLASGNLRAVEESGQQLRSRDHTAQDFITYERIKALEVQCYLNVGLTNCHQVLDLKCCRSLLFCGAVYTAGEG